MVRKFKTLKQSLTNHKLETLTVQVCRMCELHGGLLLSVKQRYTILASARGFARIPVGYKVGCILF